ncbi:MAG: hypothetical protein IT529_02380 [Burkholderiales bacterium]|nr:hypothetical protein [Burkholderiales bacterium]
MAHLARTLRRKFGIAARRVSVQAHVPWYWRWLGILLGGAVIAGIGWATYDFGMEFAGFRQSEAARALARLNEEIKARDEELGALRRKQAAAERQLQIERATFGDLEKQMKALAEENAVLREDLAFFQSLMPSGATNTPGVTINRARVQPESVPGEYRYRLLLVQTGQRAREFQGNLQLAINLTQEERRFVVMVPSDAAKGAKEYQVNFKFFQRVEGSFRVPAGAVVQSVQMRVFENGASTPKLTQTVKPS